VDQGWHGTSDKPGISLFFMRGSRMTLSVFSIRTAGGKKS